MFVSLQILLSQLYFIIVRLLIVKMGETFSQSQQATINLVDDVLGLRSHNIANKNGLTDAIGGDVTTKWTFDLVYLLGLAFFGNFIARRRAQIGDPEE